VGSVPFFSVSSTSPGLGRWISRAAPFASASGTSIPISASPNVAPFHVHKHLDAPRVAPVARDVSHYGLVPLPFRLFLGIHSVPETPVKPPSTEESALNLRLIALLALLSAALAPAQVTVPRFLSDHMVVQRNMPVHIWGMAAPGEKVSVTFRGQTETASATNLGRWSVYLKPGAAGGPFDIAVTGPPTQLDDSSAAPTQGPAQVITIHDVLVGDVWIASGQSNMQFALEGAASAATDLPKAGIPDIRLLLVDDKAADYPQDDLPTTGWAASTPESAKQFSAVAWFFAREIHQREHVPVGIIASSWGGTTAEAWTRMTALGQDAQINSLFAARGQMMDQAADTALTVKDEDRQRAEDRAQGKPEPQFPWHAPFE